MKFANICIVSIITVSPLFGQFHVRDNHITLRGEAIVFHYPADDRRDSTGGEQANDFNYFMTQLEPVLHNMSIPYVITSADTITFTETDTLQWIAGHDSTGYCLLLFSAQHTPKMIAGIQTDADWMRAIHKYYSTQ